MQDQFLLDTAIHFLNHGSFGAVPRVVFDDWQAWQREAERNPVEFMGRRSGDLLAGARAALGGLLGAQADDLVFVTNATTGVNLVARSLALQPGDEVITTDHEYGACVAAWQRVLAERGARLVTVPIPLPYDAASVTQRLMDAVTPRTRMVYLSHLSSTTALIFPVAEVCREARARGLLTLIDGAHAPGQLPLNLEALGADFYTGNAHKWLYAPRGSAFLHVRPEHQAQVHAGVTSWGYVEGTGGHAGFDAFLGRNTLARRLQWQGTRDLTTFLAVPAAIRFHQQPGMAERRAQCHADAVALMHRMAARQGLAPVAGDEDFAQLVVIPVPHQDADALRQRLFEESRIEVPVTQHAGQTFVRVSVQVYTTAADLQALEQAPALRARIHPGQTEVSTTA